MARTQTPRIRPLPIDYRYHTRERRGGGQRRILHIAAVAGIVGMSVLAVRAGLVQREITDPDVPAVATTAHVTRPLAPLLDVPSPAQSAIQPSDTALAPAPPAPQPLAAATFLVNSLPVGCHAAPEAGASIAAERPPASIMEMDAIIRQSDGTWLRDASAACWVRSEPGPTACIVNSSAEADACASPLRSALAAAAPAEVADSSTPPPIVASAPPVVAAPARPPAAAPRPAGAAPRGAPAPAPAPAVAAATSPGSWTVIVASLSAEAGRTQADAEAMAAAVRASGNPAWVLLSSNYGSLRSGYWVVYSGSFGSQTEARNHLARLQAAGYGDAYFRYVGP